MLLAELLKTGGEMAPCKEGHEERRNCNDALERPKVNFVILTIWRYVTERLGWPRPDVFRFGVPEIACGSILRWEIDRLLPNRERQ